MIWGALGGLALFSSLWLIWPFLRSTVMETGASDAAVSIYSDQIGEVSRDRDRGLISADEAAAALKEIEWRQARAARGMSTALAVSHRSVPAAALAGLFALGVALGGYILTGAPQAPDRPLAERTQEQLAQRAAAGDITARIQLLIEQTEAEPESFEAWWLLARAHASVGDHAASAEAYRRAVLLRGDDPGVLSAYAEAMTLANGNKVPEGAEIIFAQVARDAADPRAFYYLALARAQRQDFEGALDDWTALARSSDANAPWLPLVRRDIVNMARFLKRDVADYLPDATDTEIATASGQVTEVHEADALRARIAADEMDYDAWIALARSEAGAGDMETAAAILSDARQVFQSAPFLLQKIAETERVLGLDLVARQRGPTDEDIAGAASMTEADRDQMIRGMVAGLAARLEDDPNDPDGWAMLIRSYGVLGDTEAADAALKRASELLGGTAEIETLLAR